MMGTAVLILFLAAPQPQAASAPPQPPPRPRTTSSAQPALSFEQLSKAAEQARNENRDQEAIRLFQQALKLRPAWEEGLWYLGTLYYQQEQYREAREVLRRMLTTVPDYGPAWALVGMSEFQMREYSRSLDHLRRAMLKGMGDRKGMIQSVFYFVAVLLTRLEQYDDSMGMLMAMIKSGQDSAPLIEPIGLAALRLPLLPAEIPPDRREMVRMAGEGALALEAPNQAEAERVYSQMVVQYPNEPGVHFLYGALLMGMRPEDGIREMKRELEIVPSSVSARLRLAEEYIKQERLDAALPFAEQALKLEPKAGLAHMMMGEVLIAKGDLSGGIKQLETARELSPDTVRIHWDLLRAYTTAGRAEDAKREKEQIEKLSRSGQ